MAGIELTAAQNAAVTDCGGALLVSAAAGSGKTRVMIERMMHMVCDETVAANVDDFLMITYTRAAAAELRVKIAAELQQQLAEQPDNRHLQRQTSRIYLAQISTVHSFCAELLRRYAYVLDLPSDFRVGEGAECAQLRRDAVEKTLTQAYQDLKQDDPVRVFLDTLGAGRTDRAAAELILQAYNNAVCQPDPEAWMQARTRETGQEGEPWWSVCAIENLRMELTRQREALRRTLALIAPDAALMDKYAPAVQSDLDQIERLDALRGWDAFYENRQLAFEPLKRVRGCEHPELQETVKAVRTQEKKALTKRMELFSVPMRQAEEYQRQADEPVRGLYLLALRFADNYAEAKRRRKLLDYSDLERQALRLLRGPDGSPSRIAQEVAKNYRQIMVDEYQDSNAVQDALFYAVSRNGENLFFVGDVKQSIYRFRMADPEIFLEKYSAWPDGEKAAPHQPRRRRLSENFRSGRSVIEAVNDVCKTCMSRQVGDLDYTGDEMLRHGRTGPECSGAPNVELHCIDLDWEQDEHPDKRDAEAVFVAKRIRTLLDQRTMICDGQTQRPVQPGDIVILLGTVKDAAPRYAAALQQYGIRAELEQETDVLQTVQISSVLSLLHVIDNPHQDIALYSALASPLFGFSADRIAAIRAARKDGDLYDALTASDDAQAQAFLKLLGRWRGYAVQEPVDRLLAAIYRELQADAVFGALPDGDRRVLQLQDLLTFAQAGAKTGFDRLFRFLRQVEANREDGLRSPRPPQTRDDSVRILSIHKSKGLEFPVVFLAGLSNKFNMKDLVQPVLIHPAFGAAANVVDPAEQIQFASPGKKAIALELQRQKISEQMRVLYVALTRARDKLIMTYAGTNLDKSLSRTAYLLDAMGDQSLAQDAMCHGHWILMHAIQRIEAGALQAAGRPQQLIAGQDTWLIQRHSAQACLSEQPERQIQRETKIEQSAIDVPALRDWIGFSYDRPQLRNVPSKITATQLKGRYLDREIEDGAQRLRLSFRKSQLTAGARPLHAAQIGTATHLAMQFIRYEQCLTLEQTKKEIARLQAERYLSPQQAAVVSAEKITNLFTGALGRRILNAPQCVREFKFSVLVDAAPWFSAAAGEKIMLQGVTDCCLIEPEGLVVIDFKTDRIAAGGEQAAAAYYKGQLDAYTRALAEIFQAPVRERILYFFHTETAISVP